MRDTKADPVIHFAPLHGITNRIFRRVFFSHFAGIDAAVAPFIPSVNRVRHSAKHFKDLMPEGNGSMKLIPQILGCDAAGFVATARILADLGYSEVNWNLGCPSPMVVSKRRGCGFLPYPDLIGKFLDEACPRVGMPISVKLRLGRWDAREILAVMPVLNAHPLRRVIIHARLGTQLYAGEVDLEGFARAASLCRHVLMYNGDIKDLSIFHRLRERFPFVREWMIGRWAISDPFLPARIKGLSTAAHSSGTLRSFHDQLYAEYRAILSGPAHVLDKMKEVWTYLGGSFPSGGKALAKIVRAKTPASYENAVRELFSEGGAGVTPGARGARR